MKVVWPIGAAGSLHVSSFLAACEHARCLLEVLRCLDQGEGIAETFILDDGSDVDALIFVENLVGKYVPLPTHLHRSSIKHVKIDVFAD